MDLVLDKLCENLVDIIHETFTKKYYVVPISQSKRGYIYLIVIKKKKVGCCTGKKSRFISNFSTLLQAFLHGIAKDICSWTKNTF